MKKRDSFSAVFSLAVLAAVLLGSIVFALCVHSLLPQTDGGDPVSQLNDLSHAEDGVPMLLRGSDITDEFFSADFFPSKHGAVGNDANDDSEALSDALTKAGAVGGTVYLPGGVYRIESPMTVPEGATLRGDFSAPEPKFAASGRTVLLVADNEQTRSAPLISVENGGSLIGITVIYENQSPEKIVAYPETVRCNGSVHLQRLALLNPYCGIRLLGDGDTRLSEIWMSPFRQGILSEGNSGTDRLNDIWISPTFLLNNLPEQFSKDGTYARLQTYLHENLHALTFRSGREVFANNLSVEEALCSLTVKIEPSLNGAVSIANFVASATHVPLEIQSLPKSGGLFSACLFRPENNTGAESVRICAEVEAPAVFSECIFAGMPKTAVRAENGAFLSFYHCNFGTWWDSCFHMEANTFLAVAPLFQTTAEKATLNKNAFGLLYNGPAIEESSKTLFSITAENAVATTSKIPQILEPVHELYKNTKIFNAADYGLSSDAEDNSEAMKALLSEAQKSGGIVFLPTGNYRFKSSFIVPEKVRIIGSGATGTRKTLLDFTSTAGGAGAVIVLKESASLENLSVQRQGSSSTQTKEIAVEIQGTDVRLENVTIRAPHGISATQDSSGTLQNVTLQITETGLSLEGATVSAHRLHIEETGEKNRAVGISAAGSTLTLSDLSVKGLAQGICAQTGACITGLGISVRNTTVALSVSADGTVSLAGISVRDGDLNGSATLVLAEETATATVCLQGILYGGAQTKGHVLKAAGGDLSLQGGIFTANAETSLVCTKTASILVTGCIWNNETPLHGEISKATATIVGNLLRSDKVFEGIEHTYLNLNIDAEASVRTDGNMRNYEYKESSGNGEESGSEDK